LPMEPSQRGRSGLSAPSYCPAVIRQSWSECSYRRRRAWNSGCCRRHGAEWVAARRSRIPDAPRSCKVNIVMCPRARRRRTRPHRPVGGLSESFGPVPSPDSDALGECGH
jgi:hypothetical protein